MDSQITYKINSLQRDLAEMELRRDKLIQEISELDSQIKLAKSQLQEITKDERLAGNILERVYEQRRRKLSDMPGKK